MKLRLSNFHAYFGSFSSLEIMAHGPAQFLVQIVKYLARSVFLQILSTKVPFTYNYQKVQ